MATGLETPVTASAITPGARLPRLSLSDVLTGGSATLARDGRSSHAILALHQGCRPCAEYARELARDGAGFADWDCRLLRTEDAGVVTPAVILADPWGEVAAVLGAGPEHAFPSLTELLEWARHLATRCPECEGEAF